MAEIRIHPITGVPTYVFTDAKKKPYFFEEEGALNAADDIERCPFEWERHEMQERHVCHCPMGSFAQARAWVVENKFPIYGVEKGEPLVASSGMFVREDALGKAYLVISKEHYTPYGLLPEEDVAFALDLQQQLCHRLRKEHPWMHGVHVFRNVGKKAGASVVHPHSQVIGTGVPAPIVQRYEDGMLRYHSSHNACMVCAMIGQEAALGLRIVYEYGTMLCIAPYASTTRAEVWIIPKVHQEHYEDSTPAMMADLAHCLSHVSKAYYASFGSVDYNEYVITKPWKGTGPFHWFFVLYPRFVGAAGYEISTGVQGTDVAPEDVKRLLGL